MNLHFALYTYPAIVALLLAAWAAFALWNMKDAARILNPSISRGGIVLLSCLLLAGAFIRFALIHPRHLVYFDEFAHVNIAGNLATDNVFGETLFADLKGTPVVEVPSWPAGYHVLLGAVYKLTGVSEAVAFRFGAVAGWLSIPLAFALATLLFDSQVGGLWAAFLLLTLPLHMRFSATSETTSLSIFCLLGTLVALELYRRLNTRSSYLLFLATLAYAVNVRFENILLVPFCALVLWKHWKKNPLADFRGYILAHTLFFCAILPVFGISLHNRTAEVPGYSDSVFGMIGNLGRNLPGNILYLLRQPHKSLFLLPLTLFGLWRAPKRHRYTMLGLLCLGGVYVLAASVHVNGNFQYFPTARLALPWFVCLILISAWSLSALADSSRPWHCAGLAAISVLLCWPAYRSPPINGSDQELDFAREAALPQNALIISNCPSFTWVVAHRASLSIAYFENDAAGLLDQLNETKRPILLYKGSLWYELEDSKGIEARLKSRYRLDPVKVVQAGPHEYGYYQLIKLRS